MSAITVSDPPVLSPGSVPAGPREDPFAIGWRDVYRERADGSTEHIQIPLTAEDVLHPREGDVIVEEKQRFSMRHYLASVFECRVANDPHALVLSDTGVYWEIPELKHHSPDVAVIFGVRDPKQKWPSFFVAQEKTRPTLIVEIVSPDTRDNDVVKKFKQYHQAKVATYVIIDCDRDGFLRLAGYQRTPSKYLPMTADESGRLWLESVGVWLGVKGQKAICYDGETGEEIPDYLVLSGEYANERARAEAERARAEAEHARAEAEHARADAEHARAEAETAARLAAEARIRELEEKLKSNNPPA